MDDVNRSTYRLKKVELCDGMAEYALASTMAREENGFMNDAHGIAWEAFAGWCRRMVEMAEGIDLPEGYVPQTSYWFYVDDVPAGRVKIRTQLSEALRRAGGHIGYGIAEPYRRRGYGKVMLRLALMEAARQGMDRVLVTVNEDNIPSRRVAEACGGVLADILDGSCRYWISTGKIDA